MRMRPIFWTVSTPISSSKISATSWIFSSVFWRRVTLMSSRASSAWRTLVLIWSLSPFFPIWIMGLRLWAWLLRKARCWMLMSCFYFLFLDRYVKWWGRPELIFQRSHLWKMDFLTSKLSLGLNFALANQSIGNYTTAITISLWAHLVRSSIPICSKFLNNSFASYDGDAFWCPDCYFGFSIDADPAESRDDEVCLVLNGKLMGNQRREFFFFLAIRRG